MHKNMSVFSRSNRTFLQNESHEFMVHNALLRKSSGIKPALSKAISTARQVTVIIAQLKLITAAPIVPLQQGSPLFPQRKL